jgi:hypothetical protein
MRDDVDIWDAVCVLSKNEYEPGTEAHDIMKERRAEFDTMSFADARARARLAMRRLRNAAMDDGGRGNDHAHDEDGNSRSSIEGDAAAMEASVSNGDESMHGSDEADALPEHDEQ